MNGFHDSTDYPSPDSTCETVTPDRKPISINRIEDRFAIDGESNSGSESFHQKSQPQSLPLKEDFQPPLRLSTLPRMTHRNSGRSDDFKSNRPENRRDSENDNFYREFPENASDNQRRNEYSYDQRPNEYSFYNYGHLNHRPMAPKHVHDPRFLHGVPQPLYPDPSSIYSGQYDPRYSGQNFGYYSHQRIPFDHDQRSSNSWQKVRGQNNTKEGHEATGSQTATDSQTSGQQFGPKDPEYGQDFHYRALLENPYLRPGGRNFYPESFYPNSGYPGYANHTDPYCPPRSSDRFNPDFVHPNTGSGCPCCHGSPHDERIPQYPVYMNHRFHWDPRYPDSNGVPVRYPGLGYPDQLGQTRQNSIKLHQNSSQIKDSSQQTADISTPKEEVTQKNPSIELKNKAGKTEEDIHVEDKSHENTSHGLEVTEVKAAAVEPQQTTPDDAPSPSEEIAVTSPREPGVGDSGSRPPSVVTPTQSRISYFLNFNPPNFGENSSQSSTVTKHRKSPTVTSPTESRDRATGSGLPNNRFHDDHSVKSPPTVELGLVRGGTRRSLQLPRDRAPGPSRVYPGAVITPGKSDGIKVQSSKVKVENNRSGAVSPSVHEALSGTRRLPKRPEQVRYGDGKESGWKESIPNVGNIDIYGSIRRRKKTETPENNRSNRIPRPRSAIQSSHGTPSTFQSGNSTLDLRCGEGRRGRGDEGKRVGGKVTRSISANEEVEGERGFEDTEKDLNLDFEEDFANLEQVFNSAISVFGAGRSINASSRHERSIVDQSASHHQAKNSLPHGTATAAVRMRSNPNQRPTPKSSDYNSSVGHNANDHVTGGYPAFKKSLASEDPISCLNATIRRKPGSKVRRPMSAVYFAEKTRDEDDTASVLSDTMSTFSLSGSTKMTDIFLNLSSSLANSRKDGLSDLQYLLRSGSVLGNKDVKRLSEIFTRMFHEPQTKVFSLFVEVLTDFIQNHDDDLEDWLPVCLERLLTKLGTDLLGSVLIKIQRAIETIRNTFRFELQMAALAKFVSEPLHTSNAKVKSAALDHLQFLLSTMNPDHLDADDESLVTVLNAMIEWSKESKASTSRKISRKLIISMFDLCPPTFSAILNKQSKPAQDFVRHLLHNHLQSASSSIEEDDESSGESSHPKDRSSSRFKRETGGITASDPDPDPVVRHSFRKTALGGSSQTISHLPKGQEVTPATRAPTLAFSRTRPTRRSGKSGGGGAGVEEERDEDGRGRIQGSRRAEEEVRMFRTSKDSGIFVASEEAKEEFSPEPNDRPVFSPDEPKTFDGHGYSNNYRNIINTISPNKENKMANSWRKDGKCEQLEDISDEIVAWKDVVETFSDLNSSEAKRKEAMRKLIKDLPNNYDEFPDSNFKALLGILCLASNKTDEVSALADECISLLLRTRSAKGRVLLLSDVATAADLQIKVSALKLEYNELQNLTESEARQMLPETVPRLLAAYEHNESRVRKASLLCLVQLFKVIGDDLWPHIKDINENKKNLLKMYFKRTSASSPASP